MSETATSVPAALAAIDAELERLQREMERWGALDALQPCEAPVSTKALPTDAPTVPAPRRSGLVVDAGLARSSRCTRLALGSRTLVFSPGVIGALDAEQEALYCAEGFDEMGGPPELGDRLQMLEGLAAACVAETEGIEDPAERLEAYFTCLGEKIGGKSERRKS